MPRGIRNDGEGHPTAFCKSCEQWLPLGRFYQSAKEPGGISSKCRTCISAHQKARYGNLTEEEKKAQWQKELDRRQQRAERPNAQEEARERSSKFRKTGGCWTKWCKRCERWMTLDRFYEDPREAHGCSDWCKTCSVTYNKAQVLKQTPEQKEAVRQQRAGYHRIRWGNDAKYRHRLLEYGRARRRAMSPDERRLERRLRHLRNKYKIDDAGFENLYRAAEGKCQICRKPLRPIHRPELPQDGDYPCIDHCHDCAAVRGLLCHQCNAGIGQFQDRADRILDAREYLLRATGAGGPGA